MNRFHPPATRTRRRLGAARDARGFTLIEILVVVAIIAIFATVVALNVSGEVPKAKITKAKSDIQSIESALDQYKMDNSFYPTTDQGLQSLLNPSATGHAPRHFRDGGYIKRLPVDPWGNPYMYASPGVHGDVDIWSYGADGAPGGEGPNAEIGNWNLSD
jgi:general secretion pathway protein G